MALRYYVSSEEAPFFVNNKMGSSDRIPTSGTYKVGDFIISNTQADGIFGWVCTVAGTPGTWIEIGSGGGSNTKTLSLSSSTVVSSPVREVTIGIKDFNKNTDFLMVYKNSTYLTEGVDYDISSDSTKIVSRTGNWNVDSLGDYRFSFVVIKEVEKVNPKAVVGTENIKDSVVTMSKLGEDVKSRLDGVDSQLEHNTTDIENLLKNGLVLPSGGDDTEAIQNMLDTNKKVTLIKGVYNISSLTIPSGGQIIGTKNTTIKASGDKAFHLHKGTGNVLFKNFTIQTSNSTYCFYCNGELNSVVEEGTVEDVKIVGFITPVYGKFLRKFNFNRVSSHCKNFMEYIGKSAEVNITNSYLIHYFDTHEGSFGIKSYAEGEYYPEGLMVNNTTIYEFERNFDITDLMVCNFTNIHSDSKGSHCLPNRISYNKLTQTIMFDTCWFYSTKFIIGDEAATTGKSYRMSIKNCCFEGCEDDITIKLNQFVSDVSISNCRFTRSAGASNCIGIVCVGKNNYINIHDLDFYSFISYIQFKGDGSRNSISNIPNNDNLETPFYLEYPVTTNNIFCKFNSYYINQGLSITNGVDIVNESLKLGEGSYVCKIRMNQLEITTPGFVKLDIKGENVYTSKGAGWDSSFMYLRNQEFETSFFFNISSPTEINLIFKSHEAVFTVGYHSYLEVIKL